ncbi:MAG: lysylphosphatidylglycerol synthase transmembrane domain-containing protein [Acidimicrobiales bacterium]
MSETPPPSGDRQRPDLPPDPPLVRPSAGRWYTLWLRLRYVLGLGLVALAAWFISQKSDELTGAANALDHLRVQWVVLAVVAELCSYLALSELQHRLLVAGGVSIPRNAMLGVTMAWNAMLYSVPGGVVLGSAYSYRQYRRFGADDVLAGWTFLVRTALSFITLALLAAAGLAMALGTGSALDLVSVIGGVGLVAAALILAWYQKDWLLTHSVGLLRLSQRVLRKPRGDAKELIRGVIARMHSITPSKRDWAWAGVNSLGTWLFDLGCLIFGFLAVGADVPWRALLLTYAAAQLASNLPITPGGLGVVEGSLTVGLVAFGGSEADTVAAVLIYRLISFWAVIPVGWGSWGTLAFAGRIARKRTGRDARTAPGEKAVA